MLIAFQWPKPSPFGTFTFTWKSPRLPFPPHSVPISTKLPFYCWKDFHLHVAYLPKKRTCSKRPRWCLSLLSIPNTVLTQVVSRKFTGWLKTILFPLKHFFRFANYPRRDTYIYNTIPYFINTFFNISKEYPGKETNNLLISWLRLY